MNNPSTVSPRTMHRVVMVNTPLPAGLRLQLSRCRHLMGDGLAHDALLLRHRLRLVLLRRRSHLLRLVDQSGRSLHGVLHVLHLLEQAHPDPSGRVRGAMPTVVGGERVSDATGSRCRHGASLRRRPS